jgi:DNA-binding LacI/PurR family transcriptional regulator
MARPALTSIDINIFELGYQAVRCLIKQIETPYAVAEQVRVPHKMIKRQSCKTIQMTKR